MRISDIEIEGYKSIDDQHLSPSNFTILIGKNNSGKSNVISALSDYQQILGSGVSNDWHKKRVTEKDQARTININFECKLSDDEHKLILDNVDDSVQRDFSDHNWLRDIRVYRDIHPDESHELTILVFLADEWQSIKKLEKEAGWASGRISNTYQNLFNEFVNSWKFVDPFRDPETHQRPNHVENMSRDASDLIRLLQSLDRSPRQSIYEEICESYENIMEGVTSLRIEHDLDKNETDKVTLVTKEDGINARFKADEISSGSKEILVLLTQIYASKQDTGLLAIEEPELHLHPGAEKKIFDIISETATLDGPQVITSTHSEVFVNFSDVSDIVTVKKDPYTQLKAISEPDWDSSQVLGVDHSNLLQSDAVVFVEGRSDKVILEQFASCIGTPLKNQGVELVVMNGDEFLSDADRVLKVLNQLRIPFMIVYDSDGDNPNEKEINKAQELGISPEAVHVLERYSIESYLVDCPEVLATVFDENTEEIKSILEDLDLKGEHISTLDDLSKRYLGTGYNKEIIGATIAKHMSQDDIPGELRSLIRHMVSIS